MNGAARCSCAGLSLAALARLGAAVGAAFCEGYRATDVPEGCCGARGAIDDQREERVASIAAARGGTFEGLYPAIEFGS